MSSEQSPGLPLKILGGVCTAVVAPIVVAVVLFYMGLVGSGGPPPQEPGPKPEGSAPETKAPPKSGPEGEGPQAEGPKGDPAPPQKDPPSEGYSEVLLDKDFAGYLQANPVLMATAGAKVLDLGDGRKMLLGVGSTALKDGSAAERLRAEKVCRLRAEASVVAQEKGAQVARVERVEERTRVVLEGDEEQGKSVSELLEITTAEVRGLVPGMPVVGRWKSKEGDVLFLAIGGVFDRKGKPVPPPKE